MLWQLMKNIWSHCFFSTLGMKVLQQEPQFENSGQSYNHFTIVNYDSSVVIWGIFKSGTSRSVNYDRRGFIRLATDQILRSTIPDPRPLWISSNTSNSNIKERKISYYERAHMNASQVGLNANNTHTYLPTYNRKNAAKWTMVWLIGRTFASDTRGLRFESSHRQNLY